MLNIRSDEPKGKTNPFVQPDQLKNAVNPDKATIIATQQKLAQKLEEEASRSIIRTRAVWHEQGEQATNIFSD